MEDLDENYLLLLHRVNKLVDKLVFLIFIYEKRMDDLEHRNRTLNRIVVGSAFGYALLILVLRVFVNPLFPV